MFIRTVWNCVCSVLNFFLYENKHFNAFYLKKISFFCRIGIKLVLFSILAFVYDERARKMFIKKKRVHTNKKWIISSKKKTLYYELLHDDI